MHQQELFANQHPCSNLMERPVLPVAEAFNLLGIDRTTGYRAIRNGTFPLPIIKVGRLLRVPTVAVCRLLTTGSADRPGTGMS
jgi:predicted DNA-binding transcriptional regulator AlpA